MSNRLDLVIFGATGFTGKHAVKNMFKLNEKYPELKWGVAGRSKTKLDAVMKEMADAGLNTAPIKVLEADVSNADSLKALCGQARVLVNCCGPYRLYGEPVVAAAVGNKCHYVDVSGEPQFIESMQLKYHQKAAEAGVYIISACGFDSIPCDMGVIYLKQNFGGVLNSVEAYLTGVVAPEVQEEAKQTGVVHFGTWESLVYSLAYYGELTDLRKALYPKPLPKQKPVLKSRPLIHRNGSRWCLPFLGTDKSIVYRTQRYFYSELNERPVQFRPYFKVPSFLYAVLGVFAGIILFLMSKLSFTRSLLLSHPRLFTFGTISHSGPSERVAEGCVSKFVLIGRGWRQGDDVEKVDMNKEVVAKVTCKNPGYGMTTIALLVSAITILKEEDKMPGKGGVLTTGAAFNKTNIIKTLIDNDVKYEIISQKENNEQAQTTDDKPKAE